MQSNVERMSCVAFGSLNQINPNRGAVPDILCWILRRAAEDRTGFACSRGDRSPEDRFQNVS